MRLPMVATAVAAIVVCSATSIWAQRGGPGPRGMRPPGLGRGAGPGLFALLRIDEVQQELKMSDQQLQSLREVQQDLRPARGGRGQGPPRRAPQDLSQEQRQEMRQQAAERAKQVTEKLSDVLSQEQMDRLRGIFIQSQGAARAIQDPAVAEPLGITDQQRRQLAQTNRQVMQQVRELIQSGDRQKARSKMAEIRKEADEKVMAVLTAEQKKKLEEMKGEPFELPADAMQRRGGPRPGQPGPRGARRGFGGGPPNNGRD